MFSLVSDWFHGEQQSRVIWEDATSRLVLHKTSELNPSQWFNWEKNRPPDTHRIQQIAECFRLNDVRLVPGVIAAWKRPEEDSFRVYDGIHRLRATFETGHDMHVLILYRETSCEQHIIDDFMRLNQSISVPNLYLEPSSPEHDRKKQVILGVVEELCSRYPMFLSPSRKPFRHNFNRDCLIEWMDSWTLEFDCPDISERILHELTDVLNVRGRKRAANGDLLIPRKCEQHDFYLFFLDRGSIQRHIETTLAGVRA